MTRRDVLVAYTKFDGSLHWHSTMRYLGQDEHGTWLGADGGLISRRGHEPAVTIEQPQVQLIPDGAWWTAIFNGEPSDTEIYCDITTPPIWAEPGRVTMVDLDLDVIRRRSDQRVILLDEDEFAEHQDRYRYPADMIAAAQASAEWLLGAVRSGREPFATGYREWLGQVR